MTCSPFFKNKDYSLTVEQRKYSTYIKMQLFSPVLNTDALPHTYSILADLLPSIHASLCFNSANLPFKEELKNTEIGHLFEHILIEYIYLFTPLKNKKEILIKGETSWDWYKDKRGIFHIIILNAVDIDNKIFSLSLEKSIKLINKILSFDVSKGAYDKLPHIHLPSSVQ